MDDNKVKEIIKNLSKEFGEKKLKYVFLVYEGKGESELKFTQHLESNQVEAIIGVIERSKQLLIDALNKEIKIEIKRV